MRRALVFLFLLSGCVDRDPCAGHAGTCLGLRVAGSGQVDQLQVQVDGVAHLDGATPPVPGVAHDLPVTTALFLPSVSGQLDLSVLGLLAGVAVGQARATVTVRPSQHLLVTLTLSGPLGDDLAMSQDLAGRDLASLDLAAPDLASFDQSLSSDDLAGEDLTPPGDLTGRGPRRVFVLSARSPVLGTLDSLDSECSSDADTAGLGNHYLALVAYPTVDPASHVTLAQGRDVVLPGGTKVATDDTFFSTSHLAGIDELADGAPVTGCVYTQFGPGGSRIPTSNDCQGWTSTSSSYFGGIGDVTASDDGWYLSGVPSCDTLNCHVYCIEQ